jgi:hypothetical protein
MNALELNQNEFIVLQARKHWFFFAASLLPYVFLAIIPFTISTILSILPQTAPYADNLSLGNPLMRLFTGMWLILTWTAAFNTYTRYFLSLWILTNERIVAVKQQRYFSREVSSVFLNRVQDVTSSVHGLIPSLLSYGTITVQSAGAHEEFHMPNIPKPDELRDLILKYVPEEEAPGL